MFERRADSWGIVICNVSNLKEEYSLKIIQREDAIFLSLSGSAESVFSLRLRLKHGGLSFRVPCHGAECL